ncbi:MAG: DUF1772 domain-containing protein [Bryobacteraceae bacterium]
MMSNLTMMPLLNIATTLCIGLLVGSEVCLTAFSNPVLLKLDDPARGKAAHFLTARLATPLPLWNVLGLVLFIVEAVLRRHESSFSLLVASCVLWVAAAVFTLTFMLPLNSRLARTDTSISSRQASTDYENWAKRHLPRLFVLMAALLCFLFAIYM